MTTTKESVVALPEGNYTITAYLNDVGDGCNYSQHFREQWIENVKLHPQVKAIPVNVSHTYEEPRIVVSRTNYVYPVFIQRGNQIRPDLLQEWLLRKLNP